MKRTRIKFCGITRAEDAAAAAALGVDALGFVFVAASPRHVSATAAAAISRGLPPLVQRVALFQNPSEAQVREVIVTLRPQLLQFHGAESAADCARYGLPYLKAVSLRQPGDLSQAASAYSDASALLLDSHGEGQGGSGRRFDWSLAAAPVPLPLILAGGLSAENVGEGIRALNPHAVDVSSGIESAPGVKDLGKMRAFVAAVRRADDENP